MPIDESASGFEGFVAEVEGRLRAGLSAALGYELGREAAAEAFVYGWEHWDRVREMDNPAGYLYRVGLNWGRSNARPRQVVLPEAPTGSVPWIEPGLPQALSELSEKQRVAVLLMWGHGWSLSEVADLLDVAKGTAQKHVERGMDKLRRKLKVDQ